MFIKCGDKYARLESLDISIIGKSSSVLLAVSYFGCEHYIKICEHGVTLTCTYACEGNSIVIHLVWAVIRLGFKAFRKQK